MTSSVLLNFSVNGSLLRLDQKTNSSLYGSKATPEDILEGRVAETYAEEMSPLHLLLRDLSNASSA